jgi:hypothetical protein
LPFLLGFDTADANIMIERKSAQMQNAISLSGPAKLITCWIEPWAVIHATAKAEIDPKIFGMLTVTFIIR